MLFYGKGREGGVICNELTCFVAGSVHGVHQLRSPLSVGAASAATAGPAPGRDYLQTAARDRQNIFVTLMDAVKTHSLGQISHALYEVGGEYRGNM